MTFPLGLQRRDIDNDAAAGVGALAKANRQDAAGNTKILNCARERKGVGRDDANIPLEIDKGFFVEIFRVDNSRIDIRENFKFVGTAHIVAIAARAVAHDTA